MPADGAGQKRGLLEELLDVVLAEMGMLERRLVQGEYVGSGLELRDGYEADLQWVGRNSEGEGREEKMN